MTQRFITLISALSISVACADSFVNNLTKEEVSDQLGWVTKPGLNRCNGYYIEPDLHGDINDKDNKDPAKQATTITAGASELRPDGFSYLTHHVVLTQPGRFVESDSARIDRDQAGNHVRAIDFYGHVIVREPTKVAVGDHARLLIGANEGTYDDLIYRLALPKPTIFLTKMDGDNHQLHGLIAQGKASSMEEKSKGHYLFHDANYSTCTPENTSWHLHAKKITLDKISGRGSAQSTAVYIKSMPVAYFPYLSFPLDNRRYSGFLFPLLGNSTQSGHFLSIPYYWNIAPNYDMTITPTLFSKRGLMVATQNRFLTPVNSGHVDFGILPDDQAFAHFRTDAQGMYAGNTNPYIPQELARVSNNSNTRWYGSLKDTANFSPNLQANVDYTHVSDDYLQQDINLPSVMNGQLLQKTSLNYFAPYWHSSLLLQQYQTLHPVTLLQNSNQYERMPDLTFDFNYPTTNVNYSFNGETVRFHRQLNPGEVYPSSNGLPTDGLRTNAQPGIMIPWGNNYSYVHPSVQWLLTQYNLTNQAYNYPTTITRSLPMVDIDSGLYFDRATNFFGTEYHQTLEPELFYLRIPYRDQYQIPVFDTNIQNFTFDQLFQTNRFNGLDRIGDANQLSIALTSRILDSDSGVEKSKFGIGRIYYTNDRQVQLCNTYGCQDSSTAVGAISSTERLSPFVGFFNYALNKDWSVHSNLAWDPLSHEVNNGSVNVQFMPAVNNIVNVGYNYVEYGDTYSPPTPSPTDPKNNLNQIAASTAWPITDRIDGLAAWNYNVSHDHFQSYLYGASYNACCYAVRLALSRTFYTLNGNGSAKFNNQILLQFVLKGLGGVGQQGMLKSLSGSIPGYQDALE